MSKVKCSNCKHEFPLRRTFFDERGLYAVCPNCGASFTTTGDVELNDEQSALCDRIYEAAFEFCKVLTGNEDLQWDMSYLGNIAEVASNSLLLYGEKVHFPAVITEQDCSQRIEEYYTSEE